MSQERRGNDSRTSGRGFEIDAALDTEGHSMLTYELGMTLERERRRQAEQATRHGAWSAAREHRAIIDRVRQAWAACARAWDGLATAALRRGGPATS